MNIRNVKVGLVKTTVVNFPGRLAVAVFLPGCNLRCDYCHNTELACADVHGLSLVNTENEYVSLQEVFNHLEKRKNLISALAISGGEALMSPYLTPLLEKATELNYIVKLDTNGLFPERLETLIYNKTHSQIKMFAIDIKTSPSRYYELLPNKSKALSVEIEKKLLHSIKILQQAEKEGRIAVEYRTVLIPPLVNKREISEIAKLLPENANWQLANFLPGNCLNPKWNKIIPYTDIELTDLEKHAQTIIPSAILR